MRQRSMTSRPLWRVMTSSSSFHNQAKSLRILSSPVTIVSRQYYQRQRLLPTSSSYQIISELPVVVCRCVLTSATTTSSSSGKRSQIQYGAFTTAAAASIIYVLLGGSYLYCYELNNNNNTARRTQCEGQQQDERLDIQKPKQQQSGYYSNPSWLRRKLVSWNILSSLPIPRVIKPNDPDLILHQRHVKQRKKDEMELRKVIQDGIETINQNHLQQKTRDGQQLQEQQVALAKEINDKAMELTFGVNTETRQQFLWKYGCTGWTSEVLDVLIQLGQDRGIVEIGAGNGQWAKAITDHYNYKKNQGNDNISTKKKKKFDFVLAYDDMSDIPLKQPPQKSGSNNSPKKVFFFPVQNCASMDVLKDWKCRGRILLLVYPSPGEMAIDAVRSYVQAAADDNNNKNDTIVYVGEGRGGANANDNFFDYFETDNQWILSRILNVQPLGNKGHEKLFIFQMVKK